MTLPDLSSRRSAHRTIVVGIVATIAFAFGSYSWIARADRALAQPEEAVTVDDSAPRLELAAPRPFFRGVETNLELRVVTANGSSPSARSPGEPPRRLVVRGLEHESVVLDRVEIDANGSIRAEGVTVGSETIEIDLDGRTLTCQVSLYPGWLTLLPSFGAIVLAVVTRQVLAALFVGVWLGVLLLTELRPLDAFLGAADTYLVGALAEPSHAYILLFSLTLAGLVGIMEASGGIRGLVDVVSRRARSARSGQVSTALLGLVIFFDDYANALIIGNTMRPFMDRLRVSREKLAYIVDATAAPVATIGVISTWTAYQVGLLNDEFASFGPDAPEPYTFFLESIPWSFYSILTIAFVVINAATLRDFGPMRVAEERARQRGEVLRPGAQPLVDASGGDSAHDRMRLPPRWWNAVLPLVCVVGFTLLGLWSTGRSAAGSDASLREIIAKADSYKALLWAAVGATLVAVLLVIVQGMKLADSLDQWVRGVKSLVLAAMILVLAWAISAVSKDLGTGPYVAYLVGANFDPRWLPLLAFISAGVIAFATGTSYGTMGILIPIFIPLLATLGDDGGRGLELIRSLGPITTAAILGGSVFGDHASPISDTTVLSSMAAGSDHIDHVRTQFPYALVVASICLPLYVLAGFGFSAFLLVPIGLVGIGAVFVWVARPPSRVSPSSETSSGEPR
jgi:Na+/H+ antiporter NhaC